MGNNPADSVGGTLDGEGMRSDIGLARVRAQGAQTPGHQQQKQAIELENGQKNRHFT